MRTATVFSVFRIQDDIIRRLRVKNWKERESIFSMDSLFFVICFSLNIYTHIYSSIHAKILFFMQLCLMTILPVVFPNSALQTRSNLFRGITF